MERIAWKIVFGVCNFLGRTCKWVIKELVCIVLGIFSNKYAEDLDIFVLGSLEFGF